MSTSLNPIPEPEYACDGKRAFPTFRDAIGAKRVSEERTGDSFHVYRCAHCHAWHVGHAAFRFLRRRRRRKNTRSYRANDALRMIPIAVC